jgi:hypothetical protein
VVQEGFGSVLAAQHAEGLACLADAGAGTLGGLGLEACLAADRSGAVGAAQAAALAAEAGACGAGAVPAFGFAGAAEASTAAREAGPALVHGLLGADPDAAVAGDAGGQQCQQSLLEAASRCAERFAAGFARCARRALRGAEDAGALVACKEVDPPACRGGIARAARRGCRRVDAAALVPGCGGDAAACARGHARRAASLALNRADALCQGVLPGGLPPETLALCFEPPPPEPLASDLVPLPAGVLPEQPGWDATGEFLLFSYRSGDVAAIELARMRPDGSDFACLTCGAGLVAPVRSLRPFEDGARVLVNSGNGASPSWRVLECTPSVADCQSAQILPIELPANPDPTSPTLQYRVPHVTRDGEHFVWTEVRGRPLGNFVASLGRLEREADRYVVRGARVIAPPLGTLALGDDPLLWQRLAANYEAKEAQPRGGRDYVIAGTPEAGHYDNVALDLETGEVRRLSRHPDHDEGVELSPDEAWMVTGSARGNERLEFLGLVPRPPYIEGMAFSVHFVGVAGQPSDGAGNPGGDPRERDCYLEPWLLDRWGERGDYLGQELLAPAPDGFEPSPGVAWHPDGTKLLLMESRWKRLTPPGEMPETRLRLVRLTSRVPLDPAAVVPAVPTPEPGWAIRYEDWVVPDSTGVTVIAGRVSGTATLTHELPNVLSGALQVDYERYSDDGERVLDGFERLSIPLLVTGAEYSVDLRLRGRERGSMKGTLLYDFTTDTNTGEIRSRLGRRRLRGPLTCEAAGLLP